MRTITPRVSTVYTPRLQRVKSPKRLLQHGSNHVSLLVVKNDSASSGKPLPPLIVPLRYQKRSNSPSPVLAAEPYDPAGLRAERVFAGLSSDGRPGVP